MLTQKKTYLLVFILLYFSGNPINEILFGKYSTLVGLLLTMIILNSIFMFDTYFTSKIIPILITIIIISLFQYVTLTTLSFLALCNLFLKIIMGGLIVNSLKDRFPYLLFKVVAWLSIVSLIGYLTINIIGLNLPFIQIGKFYKSYILYCTLPNEALLRNNGMFWEPGAYAGILTLCLAVNFKYLNYYWVNYKLHLISIIAALISTQSTTGYLVGFIILIFHFYRPGNLLLTLIIVGFLFLVGLIVYESNDFLKAKIESQFEESSSQEIGEFSNSRFGSLIFDWHYIKKHPFTGNGFIESTRYADHRYLFIGEKGDAIGSGNAFSNFLASMGIVFVSLYFILLWKSVIPLGKLFANGIILVVLFNLQGEQWLNYPLYLGLPFITFVKMNQISKTVFNKRNLPEF